MGLLLGLLSYSQVQSIPLSAEEAEYNHWLQSDFCKGGLQILQPHDPFEEEKGESRATTPGTTPTIEAKLPHDAPGLHIMYSSNTKSLTDEELQIDFSKSFLQALAESRVQDFSVKTFLGYSEKYCKSHYILSPIEFSLDHPVEEVGRLVVYLVSNTTVRNNLPLLSC